MRCPTVPKRSVRNRCAVWLGCKLVDVSCVVTTQKEEYTEAGPLLAYCYNRVEKWRSFYRVPYTATAAEKAFKRVEEKFAKYPIA